MDGLVNFLAMGGYASYVWPALGATVLVLAVLLVVSARGARAREAELADQVDRLHDRLER